MTMTPQRALAARRSAGSGLAPRVSIAGDGVAARCCAHLLDQLGVEVSVEAASRPRVPAIMLGEQALSLLRSVAGQPDLFAEQPSIDRRVVAWGEGAAPVSIEHRAVVVSEAALLDALPFPRPGPGAAGSAFKVHGAAVAGPRRRRFGTRRAVAAPAVLRPAVDRRTAWIESVDYGWLFLIPGAGSEAWLLAIGAPAERLLSVSRLVAPLLTGLGSASPQFDAYPQISSPLCGADWLACGAAAVAFDPICGDGAAQAVREAILAAAVIRGMADGADPAPLLAHYQAMLTAAMRRHLTLCQQFYRTGGTGDWWQAELDALARGHGWCSDQLERTPGPQFRLQGLALVPKEPRP